MAQLSFMIQVVPGPGEDAGEVLADLSARLAGFTGHMTFSAVPQGWTPDRADALVEPMTDFARAVVRYVAEHGPTVPIADVMDHFNVKSGQSLGGRMASLGFALNKIDGAHNPLPAKGDQYVIDPEVAQVLLGALERRAARDSSAGSRKRT